VLTDLDIVYVFFVLLGVWLVGDVLLFMRYWQYKRSYLRYFSRDTWWGPFDTHVGAMFERQAFPELERMRWQVWWRYAQYWLWTVGLPMLALGVVLLLTFVNGHWIRMFPILL
jgi:hypothetical protein